jgi:hypothetical protein
MTINLNFYEPYSFYILSTLCGTGLVCNLISLGIFTRKKLDKYYSKNLFRLNLLNDSLNLVFLLIQQTYLANLPNSIYFCKFFFSIIFIIPAYSAWILVYISIERFIRFLNNERIKQILDRKYFNSTILISILLTCFFYYTPVWYYTEVIYITTNNNNNNSQYDYYYTYHNGTIGQCYLNENIVKVITFMNMPFSCLMPFLCLIMCSIQLIHSIRLLRLRIINQTNQSSEINLETLKKDKEFALTTLTLDCIFLLFYFPYNFLIFFEYFYQSTDLFTNIILFHFNCVLLFLYYLGFGSNLFIYLSVNKMFRDEFISLFVKN